MEHHHRKFRNTIEAVFGLDVKIIVYMHNKGLIEYPTVIDEENSENYIQLISNTCIDKILSYLFCDKSPIIQIMGPRDLSQGALNIVMMKMNYVLYISEKF
jgi:hypothetical protein